MRRVGLIRHQVYECKPAFIRIPLRANRSTWSYLMRLNNPIYS